MKKFIIAALIFGIYQNWGSIDRFIFGAPDYSATGNEVVLYSTSWCGYCQKTRELFADNNVPYVERDIEKSEKHHREYRKLGGRGVPVINVNGTVIHGYAPENILATLHSD
ncbi:MAG: glutaredoxin family protein [Gammaproteobacteria bacterium]|nr:glutaredoxin family protein [Gammaproteobacteria bacterium]MDH4314993.1 glutaredoxin family protein [Gammaproteobacteria bacterium]MDH5215523.1 glutaredoxin family protein [Gammaproteobacteria bacterium]MDH5499923.1 glutaredoxin family protein [Gammaproteobacteria bacterium]